MSPDPSTILFPLRSNASALFAGPGVSGVRRRILAAALLHDAVVLADGIHTSWAGATGASSTTAYGEREGRWQTPRQRGAATGAEHYVALRPSDAPETAPFHPVVVSNAEFSWHATLSPSDTSFRRRLQAGSLSGMSTTTGRPKRLSSDGSRPDREEDFRLHRFGPRPEPPGGRRVHGAILSAGYYNLAVAASARVAVSVDRRHRLAIEARIRAGDASNVGGHYAIALLLPTELTWTDVPELRRHRALRDYRAIVREIEAEALATGSSGSLDARIHREYERRLVEAPARGVPFGGRVALQADGFVLGAGLDAAAPIAGGAVATGATFVATEVLTRAARPRWLAVDRRLGGQRNGL